MGTQSKMLRPGQTKDEVVRDGRPLHGTVPNKAGSKLARFIERNKEKTMRAKAVYRF